MKRNLGVVKSAKITNVISAGLMFLSGLVLLLFPDLDKLPAQRFLLGSLFALVGATKLFGYFSNDLYRLAFQFDLAIGSLCELLALLLLFFTQRIWVLMPTLISVYVILDSLFKIQTALDARRFGMKRWLWMLLSAAVLCVAGGFALCSVLKELFRPAAAVGIALMTAGLVNAFITAYTVRVRARKKNLSDRYGTEED